MLPVARHAARPRPAELVVAVIALVWSGVLLHLRDEPLIAQTLSNVGLWAISQAAGVGAFRRSARHEGMDRRFWVLIGAAMTSWAMGQLVWTWYESVLSREVPFPSPSDLGYLGLAPLAAAAMLVLPMAAQSAAGKLRTIFDGLMVATSLLLCSWVLVLQHVFRAGVDSLVNTTISLAYPVGDVVLMTMVVTTWLRARRTDRRLPVSLPFLATGLLAFAAADSGFTYETTLGSYNSGSIIDLGWFAGFSLILVSALRDEPGDDAAEADEEVQSLPLGSWLPYAAVLAALLTSVAEVVRTGHSDLVLMWLRTAIIVLLVGRQVLTLLENQALTRTLEDRVRARTSELATSRERFLALVQHSSDIVTLVDRQGLICYQSASIVRILGYDALDMQGKPLSCLMDAKEAAFLEQALEHAAAEDMRMHTVTSTWRHADGRDCRVEITITNLLSNPHLSGLVLNTRDVTDRVQLEQQLTGMAFSDSLTGLPNRALFRDRLQHALTRRGTDDRGVAVLFLDLDGFKSINDTLGHSAGDELLVAVAERLRAVVRSGDTVARFGGDEFAVLLEGATAEEEIVLAERVNQAVQEPVELQGERVHIAASVGIARMDEHSASAEQVLRNADLAMYQAKAAGAGGYSVFHPDMHAGLVERVRLESDLRTAVDDNEIVVHYQPMISLRTGRISGTEALVRWQHPERGLVSPESFIAIAEASGLIRDIGLFVLREACAQTMRWQAAYSMPGPLKVSVNVSPRQLLQEEFPDQVRHVLEDTGLPPAQLTLEMTESVLIDNGDETLRSLTRLRDLGVRLALDDFGTGYSSLSYLHRFPVDVLKVDRSFIERLSNGGDAALVNTILRLGHTLQLETVAEGIERPQEVLSLRRLGCTTGQGFYFSPPLEADALADMLDESQPAQDEATPA
ncbi:MAG TPA: EAL domain-containing protein [Nocardioidaceae bacterium]|nr:EAL domain-containing protein [Nocardioidaceae bacterium]